VKPEMGVAIYRIFILCPDCNPRGEVGFDRLKRGMGTELDLGISTFRIRLTLGSCRTLLATPWDWRGRKCSKESIMIDGDLFAQQP
jgi:hypothetical protein